MQVPIGTEDSLKGLIDLVDRRAFMFEGSSGERVVGERRGKLQCLPSWQAS